jgi:hypothetical protein
MSVAGTRHARRGLLRRFGRPRQDEPPRPSTPPPETGAAADDAELDALRGELVRELNRLAQRSHGVD